MTLLAWEMQQEAVKEVRDARTTNCCTASPLPQSRLCRPARGVQRQHQGEPTLPLPRLRRLVRRHPRHPAVLPADPPEEIARALLVALRRGSLRAAEEVTGHKYETISHWLELAAAHAEALTRVLVHDLRLSTLEIDEFWPFVGRKRAASPRTTRPRLATAAAA